MGINYKGRDLKISKKSIAQREKCSAEEMTIVFSFRHLTSCKDYNFYYFDKRKKNSEIANAIVSLTEKLTVISKKTWDDFYAQPKNSGYELLKVDNIKSSLISGLDIILTKDEKILSIRFNGQNSRLLMKRGTKCPRVAHVLAIDYDLTAYKHE